MPGLEITVAVFDCGGTLLELDPPKEETCQRTLAGLGFSVGLPAIRTAYHAVESTLPHNSSELKDLKTRERFYQCFNERLAIELGLHGAARTIDEALQAGFSSLHWQPIEGVVETLERVGGHLDMYVLANWNARLEQLLSDRGLSIFFREVHASEILGAEKPDRAIFERFLERTGVEPARALYIGNDYHADVVGSRRAGFVPVLIDREERHPHEIDCSKLSDIRRLPALLHPTKD